MSLVGVNADNGGKWVSSDSATSRRGVEPGNGFGGVKSRSGIGYEGGGAGMATVSVYRASKQIRGTRIGIAPDWKSGDA